MNILCASPLAQFVMGDGSLLLFPCTFPLLNFYTVGKHTISNALLAVQTS